MSSDRNSPQATLDRQEVIPLALLVLVLLLLRVRTVARGAVGHRGRHRGVVAPIQHVAYGGVLAELALTHQHLAGELAGAN